MGKLVSYVEKPDIRLEHGLERSGFLHVVEVPNVDRRQKFKHTI